jgi:hypothetical protein
LVELLRQEEAVGDETKNERRMTRPVPFKPAATVQSCLINLDSTLNWARRHLIL